MEKLKLSDFDSQNSEAFANEIRKGVLIIEGNRTVSIMERTSNGFEYSIYNRSAKWSDAFECFDDDELIDGGVNLGGSYTGIADYFVEMINDVETNKSPLQ